MRELRTVTHAASVLGRLSGPWDPIKTDSPRQQLQFSRSAILGVEVESQQVVRDRAYVRLSCIRKHTGLYQLSD